MNAIDVKDMRYTYDGRKYAVDGITFSVKEGNGRTSSTLQLQRGHHE